MIIIGRDKTLSSKFRGGRFDSTLQLAWFIASVNCFLTGLLSQWLISGQLQRVGHHDLFSTVINLKTDYTWGRVWQIATRRPASHDRCVEVRATRPTVLRCSSAPPSHPNMILSGFGKSPNVKVLKLLRVHKPAGYIAEYFCCPSLFWRCC